MRIPHASPDPLTSMMREARRAPASSRLALRDVAKTWFSRLLIALWREGFEINESWRTCRGGEKTHDSTTVKFYWKRGKFSSLWRGVVDI